MNTARSLSIVGDAAAGEPHRVLIVDDSVAVGRFLTRVLSGDPRLTVVGQALDPYQAREMIKALNPDVLTLDVQMPRMDGVTFLKNLMRLRPLPVVMLSSLTEAGARTTLDALEAGAVDYLPKRDINDAVQMAEYAEEILLRVCRAARIRVHPVLQDPAPSEPVAVDKRALGVAFQRLEPATRVSREVSRFVCIGASTGGPEAIRSLLSTLHAADCAIAIAQHMSPGFMSPFAERLNGLSSFELRLAEDGEPVLPGRGYVAPGDRHLCIVRRRGGLVCEVNDADKMQGHRPSVDRLFLSAAQALGPAALGILLTGMGADGAQGLLAMHKAGSFTVVQDEQSSAVWGMPGRAAELAAHDLALPLRDIGTLVSTALQRTT